MSQTILTKPIIHVSFGVNTIYSGSAVDWCLMARTPDPEVGGSSPTRVKPCSVLEQGTFTPPKILVIPRKRWLRLNMTEKLFTGTLRINQPTNNHLFVSGRLSWPRMHTASEKRCIFNSGAVAFL